MRPAPGVSSSVALVAALRIQLPPHHRLVAALSHHGGVAAMPSVTESALKLVPRFKCRPCSACGRAGLASFRPLHFTAASVNDGGTLSFHSDGRKLARPDETSRVPNMAARLRPASKALAREATPGQDHSNSTARLRPVQGISSSREIGHFCTASISQATLRRTETTELTDGGPNASWLDRHPGAGLRGQLSQV